METMLVVVDGVVTVNTKKVTVEIEVILAEIILEKVMEAGSQIEMVLLVMKMVFNLVITRSYLCQTNSDFQIQFQKFTTTS